MNDESTESKAGARPDEEPDYDHVSRDEFTPIWEIAIFMGVLLAVLGAIIAYG